MKIKVQCGKFLHEFEGAMVKYSVESMLSDKRLTIESSQSGEYYDYEFDCILTGKRRSSHHFPDEGKVAIFNTWEGVIIEGGEECTNTSILIAATAAA